MAHELTPQASRILDRAQVLIAAGGYNGFSYADVSVDVGITKASIHHHFPKKSDLVRTLLQRYRAAAQDGLAVLRAKIAGADGQLRAYAGWWAACIADGSMPICICAMLGAEIPALPEEIAAEVHAHFTFLAGWLEGVLAAGAAAGVFQLRNTPAAEAQAFMATVHGAMLSARALGDPSLFKSIVNSTLQRMTAVA
jgi:TetR/AcrR family transcriptional repressor of nem operon